LGLLIGGAVLTETVLGLPGLGKMVIDATSSAQTTVYGTW
jgi:ABC-type dipeptide/oligopeptide/nickel transport system permease component